MDIPTLLADLVDTVTPWRPFDLAELLAALGRRHGKPITVVRAHTGSGALSGMMVRTQTVDYIYCAASLSAIHARHVVLHEVAHVILDHGHTGGEDALNLLLPSLPPQMIRRIFGRRHGYTEPAEQEAELLASLLLARTTTADLAGTAAVAQAALPPGSVTTVSKPGSLPPTRIRKARNATRALTPLWTHLTQAVPEVHFPGQHATLTDLTPAERAVYRLHRRVIEIRDAQLALRQHTPPTIPERATARARRYGLGPALADTVAEAAELHHALHRRRAGQPHQSRATPAPTAYPHPTPSLAAEAHHLIRLSTLLSHPLITDPNPAPGAR